VLDCLFQAELLQVQNAAVLDPVAAVVLYMGFASGADVANMTDIQLDQHVSRLMNDPTWLSIRNDAALFAYSSCPRTGYRSTPDNDAFVREYAGHRPLTFSLLQMAVAELKRAQTRGEMQRRRNQPVSVQELDSLDDQAVQRTYQETMLERAKRIRAADGGQQQPTDPVSVLLKQKADFENR
jgi:hypothetical protein